MIEYVQDMEARSRRRDIIVDDEKIYQFYEQRIPDGIYSTAQFEKWLRQETRNNPKLLHMELHHVMRDPEQQISENLYPTHLNIEGMQLPLEYHFEPGHEADGITLVVPAAVLNQIMQHHVDFLVPGLLEEKITALIRGLPKTVRKKFVPAPDYARRCVEQINAGQLPLLQSLGKVLKQMTGIHVDETAWDLKNLPLHLKMRYRVLGSDGKTLDLSRDLLQLQHKYAGSGGAVPTQATGGTLSQTGMKHWDFSSLPEKVETQAGGIKMIGYPAIVDDGDSVSIKVMDSPDNARRSQQAGLRKLIILELGKEIRYLRKNLPNLQQLQLRYAKAPEPSTTPPASQALGLEEELIGLIIDRAFLQGKPDIRKRKEFEDRIEACRGSLLSVSDEVHTLVSELLDRYQKVRKRLAGMNQINWLKSVNDVRNQLDELVFRGFLLGTGYDKLAQLPRYLKAVDLRLDKLENAAVRDQQKMEEMRPLLEELQTRRHKLSEVGRSDPRLEEIYWMIQELRISFFAQELKTPYPVSVKRIQKRWRELGL